MMEFFDDHISIPVVQHNLLNVGQLLKHIYIMDYLLAAIFVYCEQVNDYHGIHIVVTGHGHVHYQDLASLATHPTHIYLVHEQYSPLDILNVVTSVL